MSQAKRRAVHNTVVTIGKIHVDPNHYYGDSEPASLYDSILQGHLSALHQHCKDLGWVQLEAFIAERLPVEGNAIEVMESFQSYIEPEAMRLLEAIDVDRAPEPDSFWDYCHPRIKAISKPRFDAGFYGDSIEAAFKKVNVTVKQLVLAATGKESDGAGLMTFAFSVAAPVIQLADLTTESGRSAQQGYMQIFAGAMTGIRNPKAHGNITSDRPRTVHLLSLASLLMSKIDERVSP